MSRFAAAVRGAIEGGFEAQASAHGASLHAHAVAIRARDPLATFLTDTFTRQIRERSARAETAQAAGEAARAAELLASAASAAENLRRVRAAVAGSEDLSVRG